MPLISVIVPVYNEEKTIKQIIDKIQAVNIDKEIIIVDNSSTDGTHQILSQMHYPNLKIIYHSTNRGKGASFLTGLSNASGEYIIAQDADLEYDPNDYLLLLEAIKNTKADLVLGARFFKGYHGLLAHRMGNRFLTSTLNFLFGAKLNDYATCYKLARRAIFNSLGLAACGFDIDVEIICKALRRGLRISEVHASYHPRSYQEGKKIRVDDAFAAVFAMLKYRFRG
ncbi:MAG: glycosyltransferase family 2 protein [Candidatus Omnitrophica bacterium]|jgi:glycosyltransferase involved in cell wall biosynthesis|nr:glycosyltransferase family 2 protein [Candidatus Omnitrophota bacterium]MDD5660373.1 glycosyltransferase family 2 protein [Candidatus Omnitrophota bacterium]